MSEEFGFVFEESTPNVSGEIINNEGSKESFVEEAILNQPDTAAEESQEEISEIIEEFPETVVEETEEFVASPERSEVTEEEPAVFNEEELDDEEDFIETSKIYIQIGVKNPTDKMLDLYLERLRKIDMTPNVTADGKVLVGPFLKKEWAIGCNKKIAGLGLRGKIIEL